MRRTVSLPLTKPQFDSLAALCEEHTDLGVLACEICERFDQRTVDNPELATLMIVALCRRIADKEYQACEALSRSLTSFREMGALNAGDLEYLTERMLSLTTAQGK